MTGHLRDRPRLWHTFRNVLAVAALALVPIASAAQASPREIAARARAAVVSITAYTPRGRFTGTGFFVRSNGTIVTNYHVIEGAYKVRVDLAAGNSFETVYKLAIDQEHDLALLRIPVGYVPFLVLATDTAVVTGDRVYTMSNPLGLDRTFSEGIVSSIRFYRTMRLLQITAPVSHGSSGGPVMNDEGKVIGVASASLTSGQNLNLAVGSEYVAALVAQDLSPTLFSAAERNHRDPQRAVLRASTSKDGQANARTEDATRMFKAYARVLGGEADASKAYGPVVSRSSQGTREVFPLNFEAGIRYVIFATCDHDCVDVDLVLRSPTGYVLAADSDADDHPNVEVVAESTGAYRLTVSMVSCSNNPCSFAIGVVQKKR
jgi:S1-C subfamily serine protease